MQTFFQSVNSANAALQQRAEISSQILEDLSHIDQIVPPSQFNDDDWYEFNVDTNELVRRYDCSSNRFAPSVMPCHAVARGMRAKYLGLWRA